MVHSVFVEQAAELLGVSRRTVYYRIRDGKLRTIRTRGGTQRVLLESIEELLREEHARRTAKTRRRRPVAAPPDVAMPATVVEGLSDVDGEQFRVPDAGV
jgi:excisionase family DNA binding protein